MKNKYHKEQLHYIDKYIERLERENTHLNQENKQLNIILTVLEEWLNRDDLSYVETQLVLDKIQKLKEK